MPRYADIKVAGSALASWPEPRVSAARAIQVAGPLLADDERVLGPDHPGTLTARNNLAAAYMAAEADHPRRPGP